MILAGTGHRPDKLGGYSDRTNEKLKAFCVIQLQKHKPSTVISGMAQGFDMALAEAASELGIDWIAAIPCPLQQSRWPAPAQERYCELLQKAKSTHTLSARYHARCMQVRNEWMVDECTHLLALFNRSPGGTKNCVMYAAENEVPIIHVWDEWKAFHLA
jgi:uncharacterized phage-like protein YoqJ